MCGQYSFTVLQYNLIYIFGNIYINKKKCYLYNFSKNLVYITVVLFCFSLYGKIKILYLNQKVLKYYNCIAIIQKITKKNQIY